MSDRLWIVTTTVETIEDGDSLATAAVEGQLAACVQVDRIQSHYRWENVQEFQDEVRLTFKLDQDRKDQLIAWLREKHPYDVPEILAWEVESANPDYSDWAGNA